MACKYIYNNKEYSEKEILKFISDNKNDLKKSLKLKDGWSVYVNSDILSSEVFIHEFAHLYNQALKQNNPKLYQRGVDLVNQELGEENSEIQEVIDYVKTTQPNLQGEALAEEILAELTGRRGIDILEKHGDKKSGIIAWLKEAFEAIKQMLGLSQMSNEQAMNLTLQEYADAVATDLLSGESLDFSDKDNFDKWKGDNALVEGAEIQEVKTGQPIVAKAYHGTTHNFYEFDASKRGSVEGHLGKVNYFTSEYSDAERNYLSEGADLKTRIDYLADQIGSELEFESKEDIISKYNISEEEYESKINESEAELAEFIAEKQLKGEEEQVLDLYIKLNNPVVLGNKSTWFDTLNVSESDIEQATAEIAEENNITEEEAKEDYMFDIHTRAIENSGYENLHVEALKDALRDNGYDENIALDILSENYYETEVDLNDLEKTIRSSNIYENEDGEIASSQVISDFFRNLGFDGIILTDVSERFSNMELNENTSHIHVFDDFSNQIKLADGSNVTFGDTKDIRYQNSAQPTVAFQNSLLTQSDLDENGNVRPEVIQEVEQERAEITRKTKEDGTWMKAPNGNPTNLNEDQWVTVRTKRFKDWFGDWQNDPQNASKVVDENKEPLVTYHGTTNYGFNEFNPNKYIAGLIFFSEKKSGAEPFLYGGALGSGIYEAFLNVRQPHNPKKIYKSTEEQQVAKRAIKGGKDGFKVADYSIYTGFAETNWAIFNPNQIKSATSNVGTFSQESNNINFQQEQQGENLIHKAAVITNELNRHKLRALEKPDLGTLIHEFGHIIEQDLTNEDVRIIEDWSGHKQGTTEYKEMFADGFLKFMFEPHPELSEVNKIFAKVAKWLQTLYTNMFKSRPELELNNEVRIVYARLMGVEQSFRARLDNSVQEVKNLDNQDRVEVIAKNKGKTKSKPASILPKGTEVVKNDGSIGIVGEDVVPLANTQTSTSMENLVEDSNTLPSTTDWAKDVESTTKALDGSLRDVELSMRRPEKNEIVFVPVDALLEKHAKDQPSYDITNPENRIKGRVEKAKEFIKNYIKDQRAINPKTSERMKSKVSFEPSVVDIDVNGKISFEDGRHRVLAAKELGLTEVPIEISKGKVQAVENLLQDRQNESMVYSIADVANMYEQQKQTIKPKNRKAIKPACN